VFRGLIVFVAATAVCGGIPAERSAAILRKSMRLHARIAPQNLEPGSLFCLVLVLDTTGNEPTGTARQVPVPEHELEFLACAVAGAWRSDARWTKPEAHRRPATAAVITGQAKANGEHEPSTAPGLVEAERTKRFATTFWDWEGEELAPDLLDGPEDAVPAEAMPWLAALWDLLEANAYPVRSAQGSQHSELPAHHGLVFASRACCVARKLRLERDKLLAFLVRGCLPSMIPPSFDGTYVRYEYGVAVVAQRTGSAPVKLHLRFRIHPPISSRMAKVPVLSAPDAMSAATATAAAAAAPVAALRDHERDASRADGMPPLQDPNEVLRVRLDAVSRAAVTRPDRMMAEVITPASATGARAAGSSTGSASPPPLPQMSPTWSERRISSPSLLTLSASVPRSPAMPEFLPSTSASASASLEQVSTRGEPPQEHAAGNADAPLRMELKAFQVALEISNNLEFILSATSNSRLTAYPVTTPSEWDDSTILDTLPGKSGIASRSHAADGTNSGTSPVVDGTTQASGLRSGSVSPTTAPLDELESVWMPFIARVEATGLGRIATVHLQRRGFVLGELVPVSIDLSVATSSCVYIRGTLDALEILHPECANDFSKSSLEKCARVPPKRRKRATLCHRRRYAERAEPCAGLCRWHWTPRIPSEEDTPVSFATRVVQVRWTLSIHFLVRVSDTGQRASEDDSNQGRNPLRLVTLPIPLQVGGYLPANTALPSAGSLSVNTVSLASEVAL